MEVTCGELEANHDQGDFGAGGTGFCVVVFGNFVSGSGLSSGSGPQGDSTLVTCTWTGKPPVTLEMLWDRASRVSMGGKTYNLKDGILFEAHYDASAQGWTFVQQSVATMLEDYYQLKKAVVK